MAAAQSGPPTVRLRRLRVFAGHSLGVLARRAATGVARPPATRSGPRRRAGRPAGTSSGWWTPRRGSAAASTGRDGARRGVWSPGPRSVIEDRAIIRLKGGARLLIGPDVTIRRGAVLNMGGLLRLAGNNLISWYRVIHPGESVMFPDSAGTGEMVTVVDGDHRRSDADSHWYTTPRCPARSSSGATPGSREVADHPESHPRRHRHRRANSVVRADVPDTMIVAGSPARIIGPSIRATPDP